MCFLLRIKQIFKISEMIIHFVNTQEIAQFHTIINVEVNHISAL